MNDNQDFIVEINPSKRFRIGEGHFYYENDLIDFTKSFTIES